MIQKAKLYKNTYQKLKLKCFKFLTHIYTTPPLCSQLHKVKFFQFTSFKLHKQLNS